jgi:hypothetical protein
MRRGVPEWQLQGLSCDEDDDIGLPQRSGGRGEKRKRDPSAGIRHRRRPQDVDALRIAREAEGAEKGAGKCNGSPRS